MRVPRLTSCSSMKVPCNRHLGQLHCSSRAHKFLPPCYTRDTPVQSDICDKQRSSGSWLILKGKPFQTTTNHVCLSVGLKQREHRVLSNWVSNLDWAQGVYAPSEAYASRRSWGSLRFSGTTKGVGWVILDQSKLASASRLQGWFSFR